MNRAPGSYAPLNKNRSSKQYYKLTKVKPYVKSMNTDALSKLANTGDKMANREMQRRTKKHEE